MGELDDRSMNMTELAEALHKKFGLPHRFAFRIVQFILDTIAAQLKQRRLVRLRNFGSFEMRKSHGKLRAKFNPSPNLLARSPRKR